jgi:hypothetical protein
MHYLEISIDDRAYTVRQMAGDKVVDVSQTNDLDRLAQLAYIFRLPVKTNDRNLKYRLMREGFRPCKCGTLHHLGEEQRCPACLVHDAIEAVYKEDWITSFMEV